MRRLLTLCAAVLLSAQAGYCAGPALENLQKLGNVENIPVPVVGAAKAVAAGNSQTVTCKEGANTLKITIALNNGKIKSAEVEYWGKYLTPGLYYGQSLGGDAHVFNEPYNQGFTGLAGGSTDPSSDDPFVFRAALPKKLIGKAASAGAFSIYLEHMPGYGPYGLEPEAVYAMLKKDGKLSDPVTTLTEWKNCWSYIE